MRSEILGAIKMKCYLSGMPELRLGLNDKVMFETTGRSEWYFVSLRVPPRQEVVYASGVLRVSPGWIAYTPPRRGVIL